MRWLLIAAGVLAALAALAGSILAATATRIPASFRWLPPRSVALAAATESGATLRDVEIRAADGAALRAWLFSPHDANGTAILVLHGVGANRGEVLGHAALFARHGYTAIVPDSRAHGTSGGGMVTYGVLESEDVSRWIGWALRNTGSRQVVGYGQSMGAAILLQAAGSDARLGAIVAEAPFATFAGVAKDRIAEFVPRPLSWIAVEAGILSFRLRTGIDLKQADPVSGLRLAMSRPDAPRVLLIHSMADETVAYRHSRTLLAVAPSRIDLWEVEGVEHTQVFQRLPQEFEERVTSFLEQGR